MEATLGFRAIVTASLMLLAPLAAGLRAEGTPASHSRRGPDLPRRTPLCSVVVHIENHAKVPADLLAAAEEEATAIYASAGIHTSWTHDNQADRTSTSATHVTVLLLDRAMSDKKIRTDRVGAGIVGRAARPTRRAQIFYFRLIEMASARRGFVSDLLGKVLAHEVGHLLLPTTGHSDRGIMRAGLETSPTRVPRFTDLQAQAMREALTSASTAN